MNKGKIFRGSAFFLAMTMAVISSLSIATRTKSDASIVKNEKDTVSTSSLSDVVYNGKKMYVAKSTFYDYYSDSQVTSSATPAPITDGITKNMNTFSKFNTRLMELMKYNIAAECPAQYPMYQGDKSTAYADMADIFSLKDNSVNEKSNYWVGANYNQIGNYATLGLVDSKLKTEGGVTYLTQSNPANGKNSKVPYFDKFFLTNNKFKDSELTLGSVKENVAFPFRTVLSDGVEYYEFDSAKDTVRFNSNNQLDYLGENNKAEMVKDIYNNGGLFPTNTNADSNSQRLNFGFGMKIEVPFHMTSDGKINGKDIVFEFSGDDDVWVFIDDILALDIGGAHPKVSGSINFATGKSLISGVKNNKVAFASRTINNYGTGIINNAELGLTNEQAVYNNYVVDLSDELKKALSDTSKLHTLTMFYMERGKNESNMKLKFNLPEPNKFSVANTVVTDEVGETFKEETKRVANTDNFIYDVIDKTKTKQATIDLLNGENVSFYEEFAENDSLIVQQRALKISTRKLTDLYTSSWILADEKTEISKADGLVVRDVRTSDKLVAFQNSDKKGVPVLKTTYTNKPIIGNFTLACEVTDKFKEANKDYQTKDIKYLVTYSNVFGGTLAETVYKGKYIVTKIDKTTEERTTEDGIVALKPGEKAEIVNIPVQTNIKVKAQLEEGTTLAKARTTVQFDYNKEDKTIIQGAISKNSNIVEITIGSSVEKVADKEPVKETIKEDKVQAPKQEKLEQIAGTETLDNSPKTGDSTDVTTWAIILMISCALTIGTVVVGNIKKRNY